MHQIEPKVIYVKFTKNIFQVNTILLDFIFKESWEMFIMASRKIEQHDCFQLW